jgi:beta-glucosidase
VYKRQGLSYAKLQWENAKVSNTNVEKDQSIDISVDVKNLGLINADEVVQLYLTINDVKEELPASTLVNFKRVSIQKGTNRKVSFSVPYKEFSFINSKGEKIQHKGKATITIANASPSDRSQQLGAMAFKFDVAVK